MVLKINEFAKSTFDAPAEKDWSLHQPLQGIVVLNQSGPRRGCWFSSLFQTPKEQFIECVFTTVFLAQIALWASISGSIEIEVNDGML